MDTTNKQPTNYNATELLNWIGITALSYYHGPSWIFWLMVIPICVGAAIFALSIFIK